MDDSDEDLNAEEEDLNEQLDEQLSLYMHEDRVVYLGNKAINTSYWQDED
jgi:hypothetical protein